MTEVTEKNNMSKEKLIPIIDIPYNSIAPRVIVTGDPYRAEKISELLEDVTVLGKTREYWFFNGTYKGVPVTIASNGCGAAGAPLCFEGLILAGAKVMLRVGTGGYLQDYVKQGDLIVATAACREEAVMEQVIPLSYPAVADMEVTQNLICAAKESGADYHVGLIATGGIFYPEYLPTNIPILKRAGVIGYENEASALFTICSLKGVKSGAIMAMDGPCFEFVGADDFDHYPEAIERAKEKQFEIALNALIATKTEAKR